MAKLGKKQKINISIAKAKENKLFYFIATAMIYRSRDRRCLILKRSEREIAHSGLWGGIGGKLEWEDLQTAEVTLINFDIPNWENIIEGLLCREALEECGLRIGDFRYLRSIAYVRTDGIPVVCPKFAAKYQSGEVKISEEFDDFAWVNEKEAGKFNLIKGLDKEIALAIALYKSKT